MTGLFLCAMDAGCDTENTWTAINHYMDTVFVALEGFYHSQALSPGRIYDQRDQGYLLLYMGLCAQFDGVPAYKTTCQNKLAGYITGDWTLTRHDGEWPMWIGSGVNQVGIQPYMLGMISQAFDRAGEALAGNHNTESAIAFGYSKDAVDFIQANSWLPALGTYQYFSDPVVCTPGTTSALCNDTSCGGNLRGCAQTILSAVARVAARTSLATYRNSLSTSWPLFWDPASSGYMSDFAYPGGFYFASYRDKWGGEAFGVFGQNQVPVVLGTATAGPATTITGTFKISGTSKLQ